VEEVAVKLDSNCALPELLEGALPGWADRAEGCAEEFAKAKSFLFLGRGVHYPLAREGALKLKESSYVHAEGYPSGEVLHGPNALVSDEVPLVVLAAFDPADRDSTHRYEGTVNLLRILHKQGARVLALANQGDTQVKAVATDTIEVPPAPEHLLPLLEVVPLQLFAYYPRNLVKSVPVL
jgi:glucosamine--fructose-6-phosphate aminotransferase (isomerizing)